jgi:hypothetical protein
MDLVRENGKRTTTRPIKSPWLFYFWVLANARGYLSKTSRLLIPANAGARCVLSNAASTTDPLRALP